MNEASQHHQELRNKLSRHTYTHFNPWESSGIAHMHHIHVSFHDQAPACKSTQWQDMGARPPCGRLPTRCSLKRSRSCQTFCTLLRSLPNNETAAQS